MTRATLIARGWKRKGRAWQSPYSPETMPERVALKVEQSMVPLDRLVQSIKRP